MIEKMIVDADLCIKLGGSDKYRFLHDVLPLVARKVCKALWIVAGKKKDIFDKEIWPVEG